MSGADRSGALRVARTSFVLTILVAAAKLTIGFASGSVGVLSDGGQSALDAGATGLTLFAVRLAAKPPDREHPYGHGRAENLAALAESGLMVFAAVAIAAEAVRRLAGDVSFEPPLYAIVATAGSMVFDASRAFVLRRAARRYGSPALGADAANFAGDVFASGAVLAGLVAARAGYAEGDAVAALIVAGLVWFLAGRVAVHAVQVLMDRTPETMQERLTAAAAAVDGVQSVDDLRVRRAGADVHADVTVSVGRTASVERSHAITEAVEDAVARTVPGATAVVHVEPSERGEDVVARTFAAANRLGLADQVHNVLAIGHPEGMWLMLHAKVDPDMPLGDAHEVTDALEAELRQEIAGLSRVEIHLEPREPQRLPGQVVSAQVPDVVAAVRAVAERHPPIVRCHEVAVSRAPDGLHLVLHCEAAPDRTIDEIHAASLRLEDEVHRGHPDVRSVTVHFEPTDGGA